MSFKNDLAEKRRPHITKLLREFPNAPLRTLARLLMEQHPELFKSLEDARAALRVATGRNGSDHRECATKWLEFYRTPQKLSAPPAYWDDTPFMLETQKVLCIGDMQIPFHEPKAIATMVDYGLKQGCKDVLLGGDVMDYYQMSDFMRLPDVATLTEEFKYTREFLRWLRGKFRKGRIIWKEGNHEERFVNRVSKVMPEAIGILDQFNYKALGCDELGIELVLDRRFIYCGKLTIIHGHELGRGVFNPVNAARTAQLRGMDCMMVFHWHTPCQHRVKTVRGYHIGTWGCGCFCHLNPRFMPVNSWEFGGAIVERSGAEDFVVENKTIIGGRIV